MDDLRSGIGLRGYAGREPLVEYRKEAYELFEKLIAEIDYEIVHRIFKVAVQEAPPVPASVLEGAEEVRPTVDVSIQQESADPRANSVIPSVSEGSPTNVGPAYAGDSSPAAQNDIGGETKVTIERGGQVVAQETYGGEGQLTKTHGKIGRNDPCWCGSGKKYKKCHYPN